LFALINLSDRQSILALQHFVNIRSDLWRCAIRCDRINNLSSKGDRYYCESWFL